MKNVKYPLKTKIFAAVFFVQLVIVAIFIHSFVTSFKEDKLTSAYELNAHTISEIKTKLENKILSIFDKIRSSTILIEKHQLDQKSLESFLNITEDKSIEAIFQYEYKKDSPTSLTKLQQISKKPMPDMTSYFTKTIQSSPSKLPFFWSFQWNNTNFMALRLNFSYNIEANGQQIFKEQYFFILFNQDELFQFKTNNQLSDVMIFNNLGQLLYSNHPFDAETVETTFSMPVFQNALQNKYILQVSQQTINQKSYLISTLAQGSGDIIISTMISTEDAFVGVKKVYQDAAILTALSILFNYVVTQYFSSTITKPLSYLTQQMQKISKGQLDINVDVKSQDEVGVLASNFKQMTLDLKTSKTELQNLNRDLEQKVADRTKQLEELTIKDPLTGAYNRRFFDQKILEEIQRAKRSGASVGLLYLDIDHFKKYNDQNGHPEGDQLLINFVKTIKGVVRTHDYFCRLGGEEFCIITVNTDINGLQIFAEKVRSHIYTTDFKFGEKQPLGRLSCSIGVSLYPDFAHDPDSLVKSADEALYHAKQGGRNRWVMAEKAITHEVNEAIENLNKNKAS